jgi:hypothetical protein
MPFFASALFMTGNVVSPVSTLSGRICRFESKPGRPAVIRCTGKCCWPVPSLFVARIGAIEQKAIRADPLKRPPALMFARSGETPALCCTLFQSASRPTWK